MADTQDRQLTTEDRSLLISAIANKLREQSKRGTQQEIDQWNERFLIDQGRTIEDIAADIVDKDTVTVKNIQGLAETKPVADFLREDKSISGKVVGFLANSVDWKQKLLAEIKEKAKEGHEYTSLAKKAQEDAPDAIRRAVADKLKEQIEKKLPTPEARKVMLGTFGIDTKLDANGKECDWSLDIANQLIDNRGITVDGQIIPIEDFGKKFGIENLSSVIPDKEKIKKAAKEIGAAVDNNTSDLTESFGLGGASILNIIAAIFDWLAGKGSFADCVANVTADGIETDTQQNLVKNAGFSEEAAKEYAAAVRSKALEGHEDFRPAATTEQQQPAVTEQATQAPAEVVPSNTTQDAPAQGSANGKGNAPTETVAPAAAEKPAPSSAPAVAAAAGVASVAATAASQPQDTPRKPAANHKEISNAPKKGQKEIAKPAKVETLAEEPVKPTATQPKETEKLTKSPLTIIKGMVNSLMGRSDKTLELATLNAVANSQELLSSENMPSLADSVATKLLNNKQTLDIIATNAQQKLDERDASFLDKKAFSGAYGLAKIGQIDMMKDDADYGVKIQINTLLTKDADGNGIADGIDLKNAMLEAKKSCAVSLNSKECSPAQLSDFIPKNTTTTLASKERYP